MVEKEVTKKDENMSLHEDLYKQLMQILAEQEKVQTIKQLTNELYDICAKLNKEKETIINRNNNFEDLTDDESARIKALNDKYNENMKRLNELILNK